MAGKARYEQRDGTWYRIFRDDRDRERRIKATDAELARAGVDTSSPAPPAKAAAAPAADQRPPAEGRGSTEPDEDAEGDEPSSSGSLVLGLVVGTAIVAAAGVAWFVWGRKATAEPAAAGDVRPELRALPGGVR
jgi:hypothetical protein